MNYKRGKMKNKYLDAGGENNRLPTVKGEDAWRTGSQAPRPQWCRLAHARDARRGSLFRRAFATERC
jgi:hypothetical protein